MLYITNRFLLLVKVVPAKNVLYCLRPELEYSQESMVRINLSETRVFHN